MSETGESSQQQISPIPKQPAVDKSTVLRIIDKLKQPETPAKPTTPPPSK